METLVERVATAIDDAARAWILEHHRADVPPEVVAIAAIEAVHRFETAIPDFSAYLAANPDVAAEVIRLERERSAP